MNGQAVAAGAHVASILLVEGSSAEELHLAAALAHRRPTYGVQVARSLAEAKLALEGRSFDLVIASDRLLDGSPLDLVEAHGDVVLLTANTGLMARALERGARDVVLERASRQHLDMLPYHVDASLRAARIERMLGELQAHTSPGVPTLQSIAAPHARDRAASQRELEHVGLELLARGEPLLELLDVLARGFEVIFPGMWCSILLLDAARTHLVHGAAPSLPEAYRRAVESVTIGPNVGSCGTAAYTGNTTIAPDIHLDPAWADFRELAATYGLRSCWSVPIRAEGNVLGTFALYSGAPRAPLPEDLDAIERGASLAGLAIARHEDMKSLRRGEESLARTVELLRTTGAVAHVGGWELDLETQELTWSEETYRIHEVDPATKPSVAEAIEFYAPEARPVIQAAVEAGIASGKPWDLELPFVTATGRQLWVRAMGRAVLRDGRAIRLMGAFQDITDRKHQEDERALLEAQIRQSQKLEAVGKLVGGLAHDFNNMLGVVVLAAGDALRSVGRESPVSGHLELILDTARRSASLTRQLLAFAQKQTIAPRRLDLYDTVADMLSMLTRLIGENVTLTLEPARGPSVVHMDPSQIDQILANLIVNARDAIASVGTITVTVEATELRSGAPALSGAPPGRYVVLAVSDDGQGMDDGTRERIFEPFFTTKPVGRGTGLGLATVYGIASQNGGFVRVESSLGRGTTLRVYLPFVEEEEAPVSEAPKSTSGRRAGSETLLLVEDEPDLLRLTKEVLERCGYRVISASGPTEALALATTHGSEIRLLVTDVIMPEMSGVELERRLLETLPRMTSLFISGYASEALIRQGGEPARRYLTKPFTPELLAQRVREALDAEA